MPPVQIANRDEKIVGIDPETGEVVPLEFESVQAEVLNNAVNSSGYLASDGTTDDAENLTALIEENEGEHIILHEESGAIKLTSNVDPTTTGERTTIWCQGEPTLDVTDLDANPYVALPDNITIRGTLRFSGTNGNALQWSLSPGPGFRFDHLIFDGGQGGMLIQSSDIVGGLVEAYNQFHTGSGISAIIDMKGVDGVDINRVIGSDCDRGIEIEDGSRDVTIGGGKLTNIDNSAADNPGAQFVLDAHNHSGEPDISDIYFGPFVLEDCAKGPSATGPEGPDHTRNVTFEKVTVINHSQSSRFSAGVTVNELILEGNVPSRGIQIGGERRYQSVCCQISAEPPTHPLDGFARNGPRRTCYPQRSRCCWRWRDK